MSSSKHCRLRVCALALTLLSLSACSSTSVSDEQGGGANLDEKRVSAMRTHGWIEFADMSWHSIAQGGKPRGPHLQGWMLGGRFEPEGDVVGVMTESPKGRILTPGYLEVSTQAFVSRDSERVPLAPFIEGAQDTETRGFYPMSSLKDFTEMVTGSSASSQ